MNFVFVALALVWWVLLGLSIFFGVQSWEGFFRPKYMMGRYEACFMLWFLVPLVVILAVVTYELWALA